MKKLYRKGQVHPSPSPQSFDKFSLSYLPATILTLTVSLSSQDKEVLAYLLSSTTPFLFHPSFNTTNNKSSKSHLTNPKTNNQTHPPSFSCYCFSCYTYYWVLWDSSPNRHLIHDILDAFEDNLVSQNNKKHGLTRREKRKNKGMLCLDDSNVGVNVGINQTNYGHVNVDDDDDVNGLNGLVRVNHEFGRVDSVGEIDGQFCDETEEKQGSHVRKIVSFIGQRIWGSVWG